MSGVFDYVLHPHAEKRKKAGPPTVAAAVAQAHGPGRIGRLNAKIGLKAHLAAQDAEIDKILDTMPSPRRTSAG